MWILRSCCYSRFAGVFQQFQILRPTRSIRCVRRAWAGSDLLGSVCARCVAGGCTQVLGCPPTDAHFPLLSFLQHVCSPSVPSLFTDLSRFCAPLQLLTDIPSYFSAWAAPAHIPKGNVGRSSSITWWKLKKALSSTHTLSCGPQLCHPALAVPMPVLSLASRSVWLWAARWGWGCVNADGLWGQEQFIIYYLLFIYCCQWILIPEHQF